MIRLEHVSKTFQTKDGEVQAVKNVSLHIQEGEIFGIIGFSGAGKSTLVRCINLLERPDSGNVYLEDKDLLKLTPKELRVERQKMGMIFQHFNLMKSRTVYDNIAMPLEHIGWDKNRIKQRVSELLELIDLEERKDSYPSQLSGGQKQRVAIARALANNPKVLLCDEATSALDPNTTNSILELLKEINERLGVTIIVITHEMRVVEKICTHVAVLNEGEIIEEGSIQDVFLSPKTKVAQEMIYPKQKFEKQDHSGRLFRLVFGGQASSEPVLANLVLHCQIPVNILGAGTEDIGGRAYGQMLLEFPDNEELIARAKKYLDEIQVHYEEEFIDGI